MSLARRIATRVRGEVRTRRNWPCLRAGDTLAVDIRFEIGFFAQLQWCLEILQHCDRIGAVPYFQLSSVYVDARKGPNWFDYFFELRRAPEPPLPPFRVISSSLGLREIGLPAEPQVPLAFATAADLFESYIEIKADVMRRVDEYVVSGFSGGSVLAVHYRGSDKTARRRRRSEAARLGYEEVVTAVRTALAARPQLDRVFVASDEQQFIDYLSNSLSGVPILSHEDRIKSRGIRAVHQLEEGSGYDKGEDALINSLLLSRADLLIKTSSFLSGWSKVFNPALEVVLLGSPRAEKLWFPDRALLQDPPGE